MADNGYALNHILEPQQKALVKVWARAVGFESDGNEILRNEETPVNPFWTKEKCSETLSKILAMPIVLIEIADGVVAE